MDSNEETVIREVCEVWRAGQFNLSFLMGIECLIFQSGRAITRIEIYKVGLEGKKKRRTLICQASRWPSKAS